MVKGATECDKLSTIMDQKHYGPVELAKMWGLSAKTVRRLFDEEDGVIRLENPEQRYKRGYTSLRISESAARRVYSRLSAKRSTRPVSGFRSSASSAFRLSSRNDAQASGRQAQSGHPSLKETLQKCAESDA